MTILIKEMDENGVEKTRAARCEFCKFWSGIAAIGSGQCVRYPPTVVTKHADNGERGFNGWSETLFPMVEPYQCCGEFKLEGEK
jgi:hypothetical protein